MSAAAGLSANLRWLFLEWPFWQRLETAARLGFGAVDFSVPYAYPAAELRRRLDGLGLAFVYMIAAPGDWDAGELGIAALPGREPEFRDALARAIDYAGEVGCPLIHPAAGNLPVGVERAAARATYLDNLAHACDAARGAGLRVGIEPLCRDGNPRFFLNRYADALAIRAELGRENLQLILDTHHAAMEGESVTRLLAEHAAAFGHFQVSNPPDRREPGAGELDFDFIFAALERSGYRGWVSAEYAPARGTLASLRWATRFGLDAGALESMLESRSRGAGSGGAADAARVGAAR